MARRLGRTESRELTRQRLLEAAAKLFARDGYRSTSVEDVAEAAGFSKGALYYNFESKDELFDALVTQHIGAVTAQLDEALKGAQTIQEKLAAAQLVLTEHERAQSGMQLELEVLMQAVRDPRLMRTVTEAYKRMRTAIAELIDAQFAEAGASPPLSADALATAILAGGLGFGIMRSIDPEAVEPGVLPAIVGLLLRPNDPEL